MWISVTQVKTNKLFVTKMSSYEEVVICMRHTYKSQIKRRVKIWVHPLNKKRITHNVIFSLLCELGADESKFKNYIRVNVDSFDFILQEVEEEIRIHDTHFRISISPEEKLLLTLR